MTRTENSLRNAKAAFFVEILNKIFAFVVRTVFISQLNNEYLGINGLFTNILTLLSFAELGLGTAIIYNMYSLVANNEKERIKSFMQFYKKSYFLIGIVVFVLGLLIIPFLKYLINDVSNIKENISFIYILFLINTSFSYFFTYKKSVISAYQQERIISRYSSIFTIIKSIIEIVVLLLTHDYILYLITAIFITIISNISISIKADRMFPFLKETNIEPISDCEKKKIFKNVKSLFLYKIGSVVLNGTDNILISAMINVVAVGLVSNYVMIINAVKGIIMSVLNSITSSIGNLNAGTDIIKKENIYYELIFINYIVYSFISIAFIVFLNPLIKVWLGDSYLLDFSVSIALAVSFFIEGLRSPSYSYRVTLGLFEKGKLTPYLAIIVNIVSSILLCKLFGLVGIYIGTSLALISSYLWIDPVLIYKYEFKSSVSKYFKKLLIYILIFVINVIVTVYLTNLIKTNLILELVLKAVIVIFIPNAINLLLLFKWKEFKQLKERFAYPILRKLKIIE